MKPLVILCISTCHYHTKKEKRYLYKWMGNGNCFNPAYPILSIQQEPYIKIMYMLSDKEYEPTLLYSIIYSVSLVLFSEYMYREKTPWKTEGFRK
jgi:hypothetical protein